jgi:hypothetical protein
MCRNRYRWLMIDAMRDDVGEMIWRCGVDVVIVAVVRWGYVHGWGRFGQLAYTEETKGQDLLRIQYSICMDSIELIVMYCIPSSLTLRGK